MVKRRVHFGCQIQTGHAKVELRIVVQPKHILPCKTGVEVLVKQFLW